ncbi:TPA: hypothetical protein ACGPDU_000009 [Raoultella ornithinolytica]|nr:hypothetical protein [Raoultella ornithinolytica]
MANAKRMIGALNVTVIYRVDGEVRTFRESVVSPIAIERYLQLECGDPVGLFVPVGNGQQVNALNIEWFEINRVSSEEVIHVGPIHYDIDIDVAALLKKRIGDERRE